MKKIKSRLFSIISILVLFTLIISGCGKDNNNKDSKKKEGPKHAALLKLAGGDYGEPTPFLCYPRGPGGFKVELIFDSLIEKDDKGIIPWLAEKWSISEDGTEFTFDIRKNVKWQDGKDMTAEDVKFSYEYYMKHPPVSNSLVVDGKNLVKNVEVLEGNKVKITVEKYTATALESLGLVRILPKHVWENVTDPNKFSGKDAWVGCGPYILKEYNKEQGSYKYVANKNYWGLKPAVDELQYVPVSDETLAFEKGDIDYFTPSPDILSKYENNSKYGVLNVHPWFGYRLIPNMKKREELQDKDLRQAITYDIDKKELVDKVARGAAVPASPAYLPVDHIWYNKDIKQYDFNLEKAKELLKGKTYSFELLIANSNEDLRIGELIKINMAKIGINITVKSTDSKTRDAAVKSGNYELIINSHGGWGADADTLRNLYVIYKAQTVGQTTGGIPGYSNDEINKLCQEELTEKDQNKRKEIIMKLQKVIAEEVPMIPLYNTEGKDVYRKSKYDGWLCKYDHFTAFSKLSYLEKK